MRRGPVPWQSHVLQASQHCPPWIHQPPKWHLGNSMQSVSTQSGQMSNSWKICVDFCGYIILKMGRKCLFIKTNLKCVLLTVYKCPANMDHTAFGYSKPKTCAFLLRRFFLTKCFFNKELNEAELNKCECSAANIHCSFPLFFLMLLMEQRSQQHCWFFTFSSLDYRVLHHRFLQLSFKPSVTLKYYKLLLTNPLNTIDMLLLCFYTAKQFMTATSLKGWCN